MCGHTHGLHNLVSSRGPALGHHDGVFALGVRAHSQSRGHTRWAARLKQCRLTSCSKPDLITMSDCSQLLVRELQMLTSLERKSWLSPAVLFLFHHNLLRRAAGESEEIERWS